MSGEISMFALNIHDFHHASTYCSSTLSNYDYRITGLRQVSLLINPFESISIKTDANDGIF